MAENKKKRIQKENIDELMKQLHGDSRLTRKDAAVKISEIAAEDAIQFQKYIPNLVNALDYPEAHTRWECLRVLTRLIPVDAKACMKAVDGAQRALFEEANSRLTLAALRFLCRVGATSVANSKKVWPILKDAIETFDGDIYYDRMLAFVTEFAGGNIGKEVKDELTELMKFDAKYDDGAMGFRAKAIIKAMSASPKKKVADKKAAEKKPAAKKTTKKPAK